jgi:hypothetical protein
MIGLLRSHPVTGRLGRVLAICAVTGAAASLAAAPNARADADPASDVLLTELAFFPYEPPVSAELEERVTTVLEQAAASGLRLHAAIVETPQDLGGIPQFFGHPREYAVFLDHEISPPPPAPLVPVIVVMPDGLGVAGVPRPNSLARVHVDRAHSSYGLAITAMAAARELLRERGHDLANPTAAARARARRSHRPSGKKHAPSALLFALPIALLVLAILAVQLRRRRSAKRQRPS